MAWFLSVAGATQATCLVICARTGLHQLALFAVAGTLPLTGYLALRMVLVYRPVPAE